jgi:hypothetical protein
MELDEVLDEGDTKPFLGEDAVMVIYDGCPSPGMCHTTNKSPGTPTHCDWGCKGAGM